VTTGPEHHREDTPLPATSEPTASAPDPPDGNPSPAVQTAPPGEAPPGPAGTAALPELDRDASELVVVTRDGPRRVDVSLLLGCSTQGGRLAAEIALRLRLRALGLTTPEEDAAVAAAAERLV
jgi:hypothetical protein